MYFFLSYARGDDEVLIKRFFEDLCAEVRIRAGVRRSVEVGFLDERIEPGALWSQRLTTALSECRSLVALCSPQYFASDACGREWAVFDERLRRYEEVSRVRPSALVPVPWLPFKRLHPAVAPIQFTSGEWGDAYQREGLRQLMRLQRNRDTYIEVLSALAQQIVDVAETHQLPALDATLTFDSVSSAFGVAQAAAADGDPPAVAAATPQHVHFVIAAEARDVVAQIRSDLGFYGSDWRDWAPYRPSLTQPLGELAGRIAAERRFAFDVSGIEGLAERLERARAANQIVVLLVDAWVTRFDAHRGALMLVDQRTSGGAGPLTAVMVPASHDDQETRENWRQLSDSVRSVFVRSVAIGDEVMFRNSILSHGSFGDDLKVVLEVARNRILINGPVYRRADDTDSGLSSRPILTGP